MKKVLAKGDEWELTHETFKDARDRVYLRLQSEYGAIELIAISKERLHTLEFIEQQYNKLREQGEEEQV